MHLRVGPSDDGLEASGATIAVGRVQSRSDGQPDFEITLILDNGDMFKFGTPRGLLETNGTFRDMCDSTGERNIRAEHDETVRLTASGIPYAI